MFIKVIFIVLGTVSLGLGIIGIVLPGLPTTPFLLLTAGLYVKSSPKLYQKLISNKYLGPYILNYQRKKGMSRKEKISAIILMWVMISLSTGLMISNTTIRITILIAGLIGASVVWFVVPTAKEEK